MSLPALGRGSRIAESAPACSTSASCCQAEMSAASALTACSRCGLVIASVAVRSACEPVSRLLVGLLGRAMGASPAPAARSADTREIGLCGGFFTRRSRRDARRVRARCAMRSMERPEPPGGRVRATRARRAPRRPSVGLRRASACRCGPSGRQGRATLPCPSRSARPRESFDISSGVSVWEATGMLRGALSCVLAAAGGSDLSRYPYRHTDWQADRNAHCAFGWW